MTDKTRDELLLGMASGIEALLGKCSNDFVQKSDKVLLDLLAKASKEQVELTACTNHCRCPECGSTNVDYDSAIYDHDEGCCMLFTCMDCGAEVKEVYKTTYLRSEVYGPSERRERPNKHEH